MAKVAKKYAAAAAKVDREPALQARRGAQAREGHGDQEVRRVGGRRHQPRRRPASTPIRWCAAPSCCRTGWARPSRLAVFAKGDKAREAQEAGADIVGAEDLAEKIQGGFMDFDKVLATPDMMGVVGRLGKVLGPRGLMPNPKVGTVSMDIARAVKEQKAGKVEFRVEKAGIVHVPFGKASLRPREAQGELQRHHRDHLQGQAADGEGRLREERHGEHDHGPGHQGRHRRAHGGSRLDGSVAESLPAAWCRRGFLDPRQRARVSPGASGRKGIAVNRASSPTRRDGNVSASPAWPGGQRTGRPACPKTQ